MHCIVKFPASPARDLILISSSSSSSSSWSRCEAPGPTTITLICISIIMIIKTAIQTHGNLTTRIPLILPPHDRGMIGSVCWIGSAILQNNLECPQLLFTPVLSVLLDRSLAGCLLAWIPWKHFVQRINLHACVACIAGWHCRDGERWNWLRCCPAASSAKLGNSLHRLDVSSATVTGGSFSVNAKRASAPKDSRCHWLPS